MVAGSQPGSARVLGEGGILPVPGQVARTSLRRLTLLGQRTGDMPALIALYMLAVAALLLPWPFGKHPAWAYNWEGYTAWRWETYWEAPAGPLVEIWEPTDGLMTDSGQGPLVGLPVAIGTTLAGVGTNAMRIPVSLLAAGSIPVFWLLGRRLFGAGPATLATLLLATSPVFLFYGRTATLVGVSLLPLLLTALALVRVLDAKDDDGWQWRREGLLACSLLLGIYAYAPVRLLWPLTTGLLLLTAVRYPARRRVLLGAALLSMLIVPTAMMALEKLTVPEADPVRAVMGYFHARGEQLVAMSEDLADAEQYLRAENAAAKGSDAALLLVGQNATDLAKLLLDLETSPAPVDYWNERGRFWPWFLLPFAIIGAGLTLQRWARAADRHRPALVPLALFLGLALPLLLTSRVHIGRLIPVLPFALLLVAAGVWMVATWLSDLARLQGNRGLGTTRWAAPTLAVMLLLSAAVGARFDMEAQISPTREALTAATLADWHEDVAERGGAVLIEDPALGDDIERVHSATYRLDLDRIYRFVDLKQADGMREAEETQDPRPALFWRGALGALQAGEIPRPCERLWFVAPEIVGEFFSAWHATGCKGAPDSVILP